MRAKEFRDLAISALVLALAFGIALSGGFRAFQEPAILVLVIGMALVAVSLGFVFHELGHRLIARRFGYFAEYAMWPMGLMVALGFSLFGFVFAAPGAVMIYPRATAWGTATLSREKVGLISLAGPDQPPTSGWQWYSWCLTLLNQLCCSHWGHESIPGWPYSI